MKLVDELFQNYTVNEATLLDYGFIATESGYKYHQQLHQGEFELQITINHQKITANLIEVATATPYALIDFPVVGDFVAELKTECQQILLDIRNGCFTVQPFHFPQTNRIVAAIKQQYGIEPELKSKRFGSNAIFRNPQTKKWFGLLMNAKRSNIVGDSTKKVEYLNLNFKSVADQYQQPGIYHPYQKNNRHWIVVLMDDSLSDEAVMELVKISYQNSN